MFFTKKPFYYINVDGRLIKKFLDKSDSAFFTRVVVPSLKDLDEKAYWTGPAKNMQMGSPQSYIFYNNRCYWLIEGLEVIELSDGKFRYVSLDGDYANEDDEDPSYNLIFRSWDDRMEKNITEWVPCSDREVKTIDDIVAWTNQVHSRWSKKIPMAELLK